MRHFITAFLLIVSLGFTSYLDAQDQLAAGPMLGYNTMREVAIWVQTENQSELYIEFWNQQSPDNVLKTETIITDSKKAHTATLILSPLEPGTTYDYRIVNNQTSLNDATYTFTTQKHWHFRESPPTFSFLAGSCTYVNDTPVDRPGKPYGQGNEIFYQMAKEDARFMLWLGDNTYLRAPDWDSRTGIYYRNSHTRQAKEIQPFLASMHHYAIWDDHDYGPNDSDRFFRNKDISREAFTDFWANPNYGLGKNEGITGTFVWNDCQYFLLDNRWERSVIDSTGQVLGETQINWLIDGLRSSKANFKFVCVGGQTLSDVQVFENYALFHDERKQLIDLIDQHELKNVVLLSGDRHHSEISKLKTDKNGIVIYEITSSALSSKTYDHSDEENSYRLNDLIIDVNNYAKITVSGKYNERECEVVFKDKNGDEISSHTLKWEE